VVTPSRSPAPSPPAVRMAGVRFRYAPGADPALDGVDLEVLPGEVVALVGPNGAGKSTLLRIAAGALTPEAGELEVPSRRGDQGRLEVGYAPDEGAHLEALSGAHNARFFARAAGLDRARSADVVAELFGAMGLRDRAARPVSEYSFGQRRKLLLVEAMAHEPRLLVMDEPTAGLDAGARDSLARLLRGRAGSGASVLLASHDLTLLPELADRIVFVHAGRVAAGGRPAELMGGLGRATRIELRLEEPAPDLPGRLGEGVRVVSAGDPLVVESERGGACLPEVTAALLEAGARIRSVVVREPGIAEAFRRATGEELGS